MGIVPAIGSLHNPQECQQVNWCAPVSPREIGAGANRPEGAWLGVAARNAWKTGAPSPWNVPCHTGPRRIMRELESSLQSFGEYLLEAKLVRSTAAPYFVRWVRQFLSRPASNEPLADQVRQFCDGLERNSGGEDWQVQQADQALRVYFVNFLKRTDWQRRPDAGVVQPDKTNPLSALELLRTRLRTRHYSYRTECTYVDWVRRFLEYAATRQGVPTPRVDSEGVRDFLTHLAVRRQAAGTRPSGAVHVAFASSSSSV